MESYFNKRMTMLEHFRYPELFLRNNKNCFISFLPEEMLGQVAQVKPKLTYTAMIRALQKRNMRVRVKELRHLYATKLREKVPAEVIDLLQGRISQSVFVRYYYEPFLDEIQQKVLTAIEPFMDKLLTALN